MNTACFVEWQVDGTFQGNIVTRRLQIKWEDRCFEPYYLIMMAPDQSSHPTMDFLGRSMIMDTDEKRRRIASWIKDCSTHHQASCQNVRTPAFDSLRLAPYFGVIDVEEMRLTTLPENSEYVALSYNWGPKKEGRFMTTVDTVYDVKNRNGLSAYRERLPKTIRDTIKLVRELKLRYLWVDSICIVQDSEEAWNRNATVMDLIYGNAYLTICAADGKDADEGLCSLADPDNYGSLIQQPSQWVESYSAELRLMSRYRCDVYVQKSTWWTRGWTFQEYFLSPRCLIFTENRVFYRCLQNTMSEDIVIENSKLGSSLDPKHSLGQWTKKESTRLVELYQESVRLYTARDLTHSHDILAAFYGIGKIICKGLNGEPVYGLPNTHFDWALLWDPEDAPVRRTMIDPKGRNRDSFPSWAWCGWQDRVMEYKRHRIQDCMDDLHGWLTKRTWIVWYIRDINGNLRLVWDATRDEEENKELQERWRGYPSSKAMRSSFDYYGRRIPEENVGLERNKFFKTTPDFALQVRVLGPGQRDSEPSGLLGDTTTLQFWTWSADFFLRAENLDLSHRTASSLGRHIYSRRYGIFDKHHMWAGSIVLDASYKFDPNEPQHFIALSESKQFWDVENPRGNNYDGEYGSVPEPWNLYHVLLPDRGKTANSPTDPPSGLPTGRTQVRAAPKNRHVLRRVGLGKIFKKAFDRNCVGSGEKRWEEIVLG